MIKTIRTSIPQGWVFPMQLPTGCWLASIKAAHPSESFVLSTYYQFVWLHPTTEPTDPNSFHPSIYLEMMPNSWVKLLLLI